MSALREEECEALEEGSGEAVSEERLDSERSRSFESSSKCARVGHVFTDAQKTRIIEFMKEHPAFFSQTDPKFQDRYHR